jgi:hypothetical protein
MPPRKRPRAGSSRLRTRSSRFKGASPHFPATGTWPIPTRRYYRDDRPCSFDCGGSHRADPQSRATRPTEARVRSARQAHGGTCTELTCGNGYGGASIGQVTGARAGFVATSLETRLWIATIRRRCCFWGGLPTVALNATASANCRVSNGPSGSARPISNRPSSRWTIGPDGEPTPNKAF